MAPQLPLLLVLLLWATASLASRPLRRPGRLAASPNGPALWTHFHTLSELKAALQLASPDDLVMSESSALGRGDFAFLPYQASDIVSSRPLPPFHIIPRNPNQHGQHVANASLLGFLDRDGRFDVRLCEHSQAFVEGQVKMCRSYVRLMPSLVRGYAMGIHECEFQFAQHRWNCQGHNHTIQRPFHYYPLRRLRRMQPRRLRMRTYMDRLISKSTKEAGYVLAITSAGVIHAVTKACSSGQFEDCGCDQSQGGTPNYSSEQGHFSWSGCSDNVHFGDAFARNFLDPSIRVRMSRNPRVALTNLHNNLVGRRAVMSNMEMKCKCHGVSGSCEMKSCWRSLPEFRKVGDQLKKMFLSAKQVDVQDGKIHLVPESPSDAYAIRYVRRTPRLYMRRNALSPPLAANQPAPDDKQMVFLIDSPSYCHDAPHFGSLGTIGRVCQVDQDGPSHCNELCCGRGFVEQKFAITRKCSCKFIWCCEVKCDLCQEEISIYRCR